MAKQAFRPKPHDLVVSSKLQGVFKVVAVQVAGEKCFIQGFDVSKRKLLDEPQILLTFSSLSPFKEDVSQAAARVVKEATENK